MGPDHDELDPTRQAIGAAERGGLRELADHALLAVRGADRVEYLQRLCTNDVNGASPTRSVAAVFTNEKGRILEHARLWVDGDQLLVLGNAGQGPVLQAWLEKFIVMEDCSVADLRRERARWLAFGRGAAAAAEQVVGAAPTAANEVGMGTFEGSAVALLTVPAPGGGFELLVPASVSAALSSALEKAGLQPVGTLAWEQLRIESGLPEMGRELGDHVNPLEAGLEDAISFTKGCYLGQEVVARLHTYRKVRRCLRGLRFPPALDPAGLGDLFVNHFRVGHVTSATRSSRCDATLALAYLKEEYARQGQEVEAVIAGEPATGVVAALPFA